MSVYVGDKNTTRFADGITDGIPRIGFRWFTKMGILSGLMGIIIRFNGLMMFNVF
jgi:hypothetical protein